MTYGSKVNLNLIPEHEFQSARYFVIKSYTEDDVFTAIKYRIWSSTNRGNVKLNSAFLASRHPVLLFFSVNGSGRFCGIAKMTSQVDFNSDFDSWTQEGKWNGQFNLEWL